MFTENWCRFYADWERWLGAFRGQAAKGIEIGVYEGRSTCWLFENILTHPDSHLWCIDTFGEFDGLPADYSGRWLANTDAYRGQITVSRGLSQRILRRAQFQNFYDFAIIDGAHDAQSVLTDAVLCWNLLKSGGVMIFDDYAWTGQGHDSCGEHDKPRLALDAFCAMFRPEVLHKEYQLIVRKP